MKDLIMKLKDICDTIDSIDTEVNTTDRNTALDVLSAQEDVWLSKHYIKCAINKLILAKFFEPKKGE